MTIQAEATTSARCQEDGCGWWYTGEPENVEKQRRRHALVHPDGFAEVSRDLGPHTYWDQPRIIYAIRKWYDEHGEPPKSDEWVRAGDGHPATSTVAARFDSWVAAIEAAGLEPRARGGQPGNVNSPARNKTLCKHDGCGRAHLGSTRGPFAYLCEPHTTEARAARFPGAGTANARRRQLDRTGPAEVGQAAARPPKRPVTVGVDGGPEPGPAHVGGASKSLVELAQAVMLERTALLEAEALVVAQQRDVADAEQALRDALGEAA